MKLTFRWYGDKDPVTLEQIRQIPAMSGIVSAVYDTPVGQVWSTESIAALKGQAEEKGLAFEVVESVPVHEEIKLGGPDAPQLIANYCETVKRLGQAGVKVICYNFMPVFDWLRSELARPLPDGSHALAYQEETVLAMDPARSELSRPGWDESYTQGELRSLLERYREVGEERLWENFAAFLEKVIPAAEDAGIRMAIHPTTPHGACLDCPGLSPERRATAGCSPLTTARQTALPSAPVPWGPSGKRPAQAGGGILRVYPLCPSAQHQNHRIPLF